MILCKLCFNGQRSQPGENSLHDVIINLISYEDMDQIGFLISHQLPIFKGFIQDK